MTASDNSLYAPSTPILISSNALSPWAASVLSRAWSFVLSVLSWPRTPL